MPTYRVLNKKLVRQDMPRLANPPVVVDPPVDPPTDPTDPPTGGTQWQGDLKDIVWTRPTTGAILGHDVVTWESIVGGTEAARQAASPNTPTLWTAAQAKAVTGGVIVSFPAGVFESENGIQVYRRDFDANGKPINTCAFGIGVGYATGIAGYVGAGCRSTPGQSGAQTTLRMRGTMPTGTVKFNLITCNKVTKPYFGGFNLHGTQTRGDNVYHEGLVISGSPDPIAERLTLVGASPGYNSAPPGETFWINMLGSDRAIMRFIEVDGRDLTGQPTCASGGWNSCNDAYVEKVWYHDGVVGMLTFWETLNVKTVDYRCDRNGYNGVAGVSGNAHGINHEMSGGNIEHIRPHLYMRGGRTSNTRGGGHVTMNSTYSDVGKTMRIVEPDFEPSTFGTGCFRVASELKYHPGAAGRFGLSDWATRYGYQYMLTNPTVIKNGVSLTCSPQFTGVDSNLQPTPSGGVPGWSNKDSKVFYIKTNG